MSLNSTTSQTTETLHKIVDMMRVLPRFYYAPPAADLTEEAAVKAIFDLIDSDPTGNLFNIVTTNDSSQYSRFLKAVAYNPNITPQHANLLLHMNLNDEENALILSKAVRNITPDSSTLTFENIYDTATHLPYMPQRHLLIALISNPSTPSHILENITTLPIVDASLVENLFCNMQGRLSPETLLRLLKMCPYQGNTLLNAQDTYPAHIYTPQFYEAVTNLAVTTRNQNLMSALLLGDKPLTDVLTLKMIPLLDTNLLKRVTTHPRSIPVYAAILETTRSPDVIDMIAIRLTREDLIAELKPRDTPRHYTESELWNLLQTCSDKAVAKTLGYLSSNNPTVTAILTHYAEKGTLEQKVKTAKRLNVVENIETFKKLSSDKSVRVRRAAASQVAYSVYHAIRKVFVVRTTGLREEGNFKGSYTTPEGRDLIPPHEVWNDFKNRNTGLVDLFIKLAADSNPGVQGNLIAALGSTPSYGTVAAGEFSELFTPFFTSSDKTACIRLLKNRDYFTLNAEVLNTALNVDDRDVKLALLNFYCSIPRTWEGKRLQKRKEDVLRIVETMIDDADEEVKAVAAQKFVTMMA